MYFFLTFPAYVHVNVLFLHNTLTFLVVSLHTQAPWHPLSSPVLRHSGLPPPPESGYAPEGAGHRWTFATPTGRSPWRAPQRWGAPVPWSSAHLPHWSPGPPMTHVANSYMCTLERMTLWISKCLHPYWNDHSTVAFFWLHPLFSLHIIIFNHQHYVMTFGMCWGSHAKVAVNHCFCSCMYVYCVCVCSGVLWIECLLGYIILSVWNKDQW